MQNSTNRQARASHISLDRGTGAESLHLILIIVHSTFSPSALDAAVFGHVVDALSDYKMKPLVDQYPALVDHFSTVRRNFFPDSEVCAGEARDALQKQFSVATNCQNTFDALNVENAMHLDMLAAPLPEATVHQSPPADVKMPLTPVQKKAKRKEDRQMQKTHLCIGVAAASVVVYVLYGNFLEIVFDDDDNNQYGME